MRVVSSVLVLAFVAFVSRPTAAALITTTFSGGGLAGSSQTLTTSMAGWDELNFTRIGETVRSYKTTQTHITGSLTLDTRNFVNRSDGLYPTQGFIGPPPPITAMSMSAVGPFFPQALTTDNRTSERVLVQWRDGTGGRDYFEALSRIVYVNEFTETHSSSGLPGEPYQYRAHTHFEIVSLLLRMEGPDGFLTEILVDGTPAPRIDSTLGCEPGECFLEIHEAAFDRYTVYDRDASGRVLANYRYYTNYFERRSQALPTAASSTVTEAPVDPVEVGEPATFGIAAFGVVCAFWARLRVRQRPNSG